MIEGLRTLVDVGGDRPQDAHEISKLCVVSEDDPEMAAHEQVVPSWACRVSWKEKCPAPKVSRATAEASRLKPLGRSFVVRANFVGEKKAKKG